MAALRVSLVFRSELPQHYVARLSDRGWCDGWGWTVGEALADLARAVEEVRPDIVPEEVLADNDRLLHWLTDHAEEPVLDEQ